MHYDLSEDSVRVVNGELYTSEGILLHDPTILVMGGIPLKVGNYDEILKSMRNLEGSNINLVLINFHDKFYDVLGIDDVCYIIRRCMEFIDASFLEEVISMKDNIGILEWLEYEKSCVPLRVAED